MAEGFRFITRLTSEGRIGVRELDKREIEATNLVSHVYTGTFCAAHSGNNSMSTDPLCLVFVPALVAVLTAAEAKKGAPLTEAEACEIRDAATCIALPFSTALAMETERGYPDIVAEDCWNEWQRVRASVA